jgi:formiminoglutamase
MTPLLLPKWSGRDDGLGAERLHQHVSVVELAKLSQAAHAPSFAFLGFCSDEGVRRNEGRVGAVQGPEFLRKSLANLSWDSTRPLIDVGDVLCTDGDLEKAQKQLGDCVSILLAKHYTPIVLGGGHETAWGHFQGLAKHHKSVLIVNFDAHYDMRPLKEGRLGTSGTPFAQIADLCEKQSREFHYICIGLQNSANTKSLHKTAESKHVQAVSAETLHTEGLASTVSLLDKALASHDAVYVSVCMDVFAQAYAPGVSAPQALGLTPWQVLPLLKRLVSSGKLLSFDCVELCPPLDRDQQTSKLAACLIVDALR